MNKPSEVIPEATTEAGPQSGSYFARHWRGDFSLAKSYWLNGVVILGFGVNVVVEVAMTAALLALRGQPVVAVVVLLGEIALGLAAYIWALVGIWRSAAKYQGPRVWPILARVVTSFGVLVTISNVLEHFAVIQQLLR